MPSGNSLFSYRLNVRLFTVFLSVMMFLVYVSFPKATYSNPGHFSHSEPVLTSVPCDDVPAAAGPLSGTNSVCAGSTNTYSLAPVSGADFYTWSYSGTGATFNAVTTLPSNNIMFASGATAGNLVVTPGNLCGNGTPVLKTLTVNPLPMALISYPSDNYCVNTPGSVSVTVSGVTGGFFSSSPAGLSLNGTTGAITPSASLPGNYIISYMFNDGTCSNTTTTPVAIKASLSGVYTVGAGGHFSTMTEAADAYNKSCLSGPVEFSLISSNYSNLETFPIVLTNNSNAGPSTTLTIKPAPGVNALIYGEVNENGLIRVTGKYISIEGSNNGTTSRNLTIWNEGAVKPRVVLFGSIGTNAVSNATIRNTILRNGTTDAGAVIASDANNISLPGYFNNISIENNAFQNSFYGIFCNAVNTGTNGSGLLITSNDMTATGALAIQFTGIYVQGVNGAVISRNALSNFRGTDDASDNGIWLAANVRNVQVTNNIITNLNYVGNAGHAARGIYVNSGLSNANILIANNMIANLSGDGNNYLNAEFGLNNPTGILLSSGTTQTGIRILNNSIYLGGVTGFTNTMNKTNAISACIRMRVGTEVDIRNNILVNNLGRSNTLPIGATLVMATGGESQLQLLDNNIYFVNPTGTGIKSFAHMAGTAYSSFAGWRALTGKDIASLNVLPVFLSGTDLHLDPSANNAIHNKGAFITEIVDDIDRATRHPQTPDIGCDEFIPVNTAFWVGKVSTDWADPANWEDNKVPGINSNTSIEGGYNFLPSISATQAVNSISLMAPATPPVLTINATGTLQVYGTVSYAPGTSINASAGSIEMNGTVAQTIPAGIFQGNCLKNLVVGNSSVAGLTLGGTLNITRSVTFSETGNRLNTGGFLVFKSTATETAWLGDVTGKIITGQATVERYIPTGLTHGKSWQFLSVPVNGSQTINQAWQEGNAPMANTNPGFGTIITGNMPGATSLGFDIATAAAGGPGLKTYNPFTNNWDGVANTSSLAISNKKGYMLFVRGDRSVTTSTAPATETVLRVKGDLYTASAGQLPPASTVSANSFESIGNPYASAIDFEKITKPGPAFIDNTFYVWDPLLPGSQGLGGYQTISAINDFRPVPGGTANYSNSDRVTSIQSGQAFFVHATGPGSGGTILFSEPAKIQGSKLVHRTGGHQSCRPNFRTSLLAMSSSAAVMADAVTVVFDDTFSKEYTADDALKLFNSGENLGINILGTVVSVEARPFIQSNDTLFLQMSNMRRQDYRFSFIPAQMPAGTVSAWLHDRFLNTVQQISLIDSTTVPFSITQDAASASPDRFYVVFRQNIVLPVTFTNISAIRNRDESVTVQWNVESETAISRYQVERSGDGRRFSSIAVQLPKDNHGGAAVYQSLDKKPLDADNFYRIRSVGLDGKEQFSRVVKVTAGGTTAGISVYPNPVVDKTMYIQFPSANKEMYELALYNQSGQLIYKNRLSTNSNNTRVAVPLDKSIAPGIHTLILSGSDGSNTVLKVIIQ